MPHSEESPDKRRGKQSSSIFYIWLASRGQRILHLCGKKHENAKLRKKLILGSWNIRTLLDNTTRRPERQTALVALELNRYNIDVCCLQETRLSGQGQLSENGYTFYWSGKDPQQRKESGVAFAISNTIAKDLTSLPQAISDRLIRLRLPLNDNRYLTIICCYAPTMMHTDESKEAFYEALRSAVRQVPREDKLLILGDFNARVGNDVKTWPNVLGHHGKGTCNSNGELLLSFCAENHMTVSNTIFQMPDKWYYSWQHPRSKHYHLLDYTLVRQSDTRDIRSTRIMRGAECSTDHFLVRTICNFHIKPIRRRTKSSVSKKINVRALIDDTEVQTKFREALSAKLDTVDLLSETSVNDQWQLLNRATHEVMSEHLKPPSRRNADWFDENNESIKILLEERATARNEMLSSGLRSKTAKYKECKRKLQQSLRQMKDEWWNMKAEAVQELAEGSNPRAFFESLKEVYGPHCSITSPLLNEPGTILLTDKPDIMNRWKEHFQILLNRPSTTDPNVLNNINKLPSNNNMDKPPTLEEVEDAVKSLKNGKSPGADGIPSEAYKYGGPDIVQALHTLFTTCWEAAELPQDFKNATIVTIFKKGDRTQCGNYRGISLLSTAGKVLAKVLLSRLQQAASKILPESQSGFRPNRSTIDPIFTLRQLQEKSIEQQRPLYMVFIDFTKAFDSVNRELLWKLLAHYGCPDTFVKIMQEFHDGMEATVRIAGDTTESFPVSHGVKQGCVLAPTLFGLYLAAVLETTSDSSCEVHKGVYLRSRTDGNLFNLARLRAKSKCREICVEELLYADDSALVAQSLEDLQDMLDRFVAASEAFGLSINIKKTEILYQPAPGTPHEDPDLYIHGKPVKSVSNFTYLGSVISCDNSIESEITRRIQSSASAFGALEERVWSQRGIKLATKCKLYRVFVLPCLLYSTETYTLYRRHLMKLTTVQLRHLRNIMGLSWQDRICNGEVLQRAGMQSVEAILAKTQLRWAGHVIRMPEDRLPKAVMYGELTSGKRKRGGQRLRFKDVLKRHLKTADIDVETWEKAAEDRVLWRKKVTDAGITVELKRKEKYLEGWRKRHPTTPT